MRTADYKAKIPAEYPLINLPIAAVLPLRFKWRVSIEKKSETERFILKPEKIPQGFESSRFRSYLAEPVRKVCEEFLSIRDSKDAVLFFERFGPLHLPPIGERGTVERLDIRRIQKDGETIEDLVLLEMPAPSGSSLAGTKPITWEQLQGIKTGFESEIMGEPSPPSIHQFVWNQPLKIEMQLPPWGFGTPDKPIPPDLDPAHLARLGFDPKVIPGLYEAVPDRDGRIRGEDDGGRGISRCPTAFISCADVEEAIRANLILSRIAESHWRRCELAECLKVFQQDTGQLTRFCCTLHYKTQNSRDRVRRRREQKLKAAKSSKAKGKKS